MAGPVTRWKHCQFVGYQALAHAGKQLHSVA
jgi:hypothetical protein